MIATPSNLTFKFPNQRISLKEKQTLKWTMDMANYVVRLAMSYNDKTKTVDLLNMANGHVDKKMYDYVLKTFGVTTDEKKSELLINDLRDIDFLQPIKDKYLGEFTSSYHNYQIYSDDPDTILNRNTAFGKKVMMYMQQLLINELNKRGINTGEQSQEVPDISSMLKEHIAKWDNERIKNAQNRLNLLNNEIDAKIKYNQLYYYWWACEEAYTFRKVVKNRVIFEVVPPQEYFRVPSGNTLVEDDDYGIRLTYKTIYDILDNYSHLLSKEDITYLKTINNNEIHADRVNLLKHRLLSNGMKDDDLLLGIDKINLTLENSVFINLDKIRFCHYFFKTEVKVGYLIYLDEYGEIKETIVDENYEFDLDNGDIKIEWDWIHQIYEGEIIGYNPQNTTNIESIYTKVRPIDIQREHFSNLNICKSNYNGISYIVKDSERKPIPYRVNSLLALYRIYHYQIERAIHKWKSILSLPQSILTDSPEMSMAQRLSRMQGESLLVFDDSIVNPNSLQAIREVATTATYGYVETLMKMLDHIKNLAWEVSNMTPSRMGNQAAYQGKSVTEYSLLQSNISNNWSLEMFNLFRSKDYLSNYDYSKIAWVEGKQGSYTNETTGETIFVDVDIDEHFSYNIGINVGNSKILDEKLRAMKELAFSASQGGEYELAMEAIVEDNIQALKSSIKNISDKKRKYEMQMEQLKNNAAKEIEQMKQQYEQMKIEGDLQRATITAEASVQVALINQETQLLVWEKRLQLDVDGNGYISENEGVNKNDLSKISKDEQMLAIKREELELKRKSLKNKITSSK